ncbi:MAG: apolipoprotein N-acyltransferase [Gemmataceae bacterium]|nr:apolipoprotein N-acyltransferase [Gemmataceae bacterium]
MKPRVFLPAILSGLLLWAAFFPLDLGPVGFVALVPWLTLVRAPTSARRRYLAAYVGGLAFFVPALNWLRVAHPMMWYSWAFLALMCPCYWALGLWLIRRLDRTRVPLAVSVPAVWVALEYTRAHFPTGFPFMAHVGMYQMIGFGWYFLGYTQHAFLPLIQVADLGGVYAVSAVVGAVNGLLADWVMRSRVVQGWLGWGGLASRERERPEDRPPVAHAPGSPAGGRGPVISTAAVAVAFVAALGYGFVRLHHQPFDPGPRVAALQGSVPQGEKNRGGDFLFQTYFGLHREAVAGQPKPDLVVWPETCCPADWFDVAPDTDPDVLPEGFKAGLVQTHKNFNRDWDPPALFGLTSLVWEGDRAWKYNSAVLVHDDGAYGGRYDKMHLVPFGEYVPLRETFPWLRAFTPYEGDYSCRPGESWTRFRVPAGGRAYRFGCLICYEDSDPDLARRYVTGPDPVHFLVNISNDGWFDGTEEHEQHLAICRVRAVEARRAVVRAVNMGISGVIDGDGRVVALPADSWGASKKVEAVVSADVPLDYRESPYARFGDWLPAACWGLILVGLAFGRRRAAA